MDALVEEAEALHQAVRDAIATLAPAPHGDDGFEALARTLATFQARRLPGYARLLAARGLDVHRAAITALPAVPADAFRVSRVATHPPSLDVATFHTSGTTGALAGRGAHPMRTLATYRAAALTWAQRTLFSRYFAVRQNGMNADGRQSVPRPRGPQAQVNIHSASSARPVVVALSPTPDAVPDSSLARMMAWFVDELGAEGSTFVAPDDVPRGITTLRSLARGTRPVVVLATAFAWVHLVDALGGEVITLPPSSRAMQTGGFKGRSREISKAELRTGIARSLGLAERDVVGEYGMTELTSQLYAVPEGSEDWIYRAPPWVRVRACDPTTLAPLAAGTRGIARVEDLGNVESAWAIETADEVVVRADGGVELLGRLPGATPRGCSLAVEELLERAQERAS